MRGQGVEITLSKVALVDLFAGGAIAMGGSERATRASIGILRVVVSIRAMSRATRARVLRREYEEWGSAAEVSLHEWIEVLLESSAGVFLWVQARSSIGWLLREAIVSSTRER